LLLLKLQPAHLGEAHFIFKEEKRREERREEKREEKRRREEKRGEEKRRGGEY
jgi:hypothetical protein